MRMKKNICIIFALILACTMFPNVAYAKVVKTGLQLDEETLIEAGFTKETADALESEERDEIVKELRTDSKLVDIKTSIMETDCLADIENLLSYSDKELLASGATQESINEARADIENLSKMSDKEIMKNYDMTETEVKLLRRAIIRGKQPKYINPGDIKNINELVTASGSLSSSTLYYTQRVSNKSTKKSPIYKVTCSYSWSRPYYLAIYKDEIAVAWGGALDTKAIKTSAKYYNWKCFGMSWQSSFSSNTMSKDQTPQAGIEFSFPQSVKSYYYKNRPKTKKGSATVTLYQTKKQGYKTKVVSRYCHRTLRLYGTSISISASGPSASISIGSAWDKSSQKASTISY